MTLNISNPARFLRKHAFQATTEDYNLTSNIVLQSFSKHSAKQLIRSRNQLPINLVPRLMVNCQSLLTNRGLSLRFRCWWYHFHTVLFVTFCGMILKKRTYRWITAQISFDCCLRNLDFYMQQIVPDCFFMLRNDFMFTS